MLKIFITNPNTTNLITFHIGHNRYTYPIKAHTLVTANNRNFVPKRINDIISEYYKSGPVGNILEDLYVPYMNGDHFRIFMDLIIAPENTRIELPHNMKISDLDNIIEKFTYDTLDNLVSEEIRNRFNKISQNWDKNTNCYLTKSNI